jgi:uncharacterized protein (TIGR02996 family)
MNEFEEILSHPEDDLPRLKYAASLMRRGDPRGEFIEVQCRLARLPSWHADCCALRRRERELAQRYMTEWLAPLWRLNVRGYPYRGFVELIETSAATFLDFHY